MSEPLLMKCLFLSFIVFGMIIFAIVAMWRTRKTLKELHTDNNYHRRFNLSYSPSATCYCGKEMEKTMFVGCLFECPTGEHKPLLQANEYLEERLETKLPSVLGQKEEDDV